MYLANMSLAFTVKDVSYLPAATTYFETEIFPPGLNKWSLITIDVSNLPDLVVAMNQEFINNLTKVSPYGELKKWKMDAPFILNGWYAGGGGLHETGHREVEHDKGVDFTFEIPRTGGETAKVFVRATHRLIGTIIRV